jgi:hypothetical protein
MMGHHLKEFLIGVVPDGHPDLIEILISKKRLKAFHNSGRGNAPAYRWSPHPGRL